MSYDEFWNGDYEAAKMYRQKHRQEEENKNYHLWLAGIYVAKAISATIGNAFLKKGQTPNTYPQEPLGISRGGKVMTEEEKEDAEHRKDDAKFISYMTDWATAWNREFAKREQEKTAHSTAVNGGEKHGRTVSENTGN